MKRLTISILIVASCGFAAAGDAQMWTWCDRTESDPLDCVSTLRDRFATRGPATFVQFGTQLSKALASQPDAFFEAMSQDTLAFADWKNTLDEHTFRVSARQGSVEADLQAAYLLRLRELMLEATRSYSRGSPWAGMAQEVGVVLDSVSIASGR